MFRIDNTTAAPSIPTPAQPGSPGFFTNGNPALGAPATIVDADWMNALQEELAYVIEQSGLVLNKLDRTQLFQALGRLTRVRLQADTTFYLAPSPTGNDNNNGLSPETPWADATYAYNWIRDRIDPNGHTCWIQPAPGTYPGAFFSGQITAGPVVLIGNESDPSQIVFYNPNGHAIECNSAAVTVRGVTVSTGGAATSTGLYALQASQLQFNNIYFDTCAGQHLATDVAAMLAGSLGNSTTYSIVGSAPRHVTAIHAGFSQILAQITIEGVPTFSDAFVQVRAGQIDFGGVAFNGTAHGKHFDLGAGGIITGTGGNPNFFPGDAAGINDGTGIYV
jgi:hypothetical protein